MPASLLKDRDEQRRFIKFALVGASGSVVDFGVFNLLASVLGVNSTVSQAISFTLAVLNNFIWNRLWTYPETRKSSIIKPLIQFGVVNVIGLGIRTLLFTIIEPPMIAMAEYAFPGSQYTTVIGHNVTLAILILIVMLWNYFANRYWTFKEIDTLKEEAK